MVNPWIPVALSVLAIIVIPTGVLAVRLTARFTRTEDRIETLTEDIKETLASMREDRSATNIRLRWLEEHLWRRDGNYRS